MKKLLVFPCSRLLATGRPNPKNYTLMADVVRDLRNLGIHCVQSGLSSEASVGCDERIQDLTPVQILELSMQVDGFLSVDTFFPHMAMAFRKEYIAKLGHPLPGVVVWITTDHNHFGYDEFANIYSSQPVMSANQLATMEVMAEEMKEKTKNAPPHERVVKAVLGILGL